MSEVRCERLSSARAVLVVVDIQERLLPAMPEEVAPQLLKNAKLLVAAAGRFGVPIVVSQQYPKGLGATVPELATALADAEAAGAPVHRFDKVEFSACGAAPFAELRAGALRDRDQWIVTGTEAHVCVYQTVRDLAGTRAGVDPSPGSARRPAGSAGGGPAIHVVADAVASRTKANWRAALDLMDRLGAIITTTEICVFDLLARAGTDHFKALSKAIK